MKLFSLHEQHMFHHFSFELFQVEYCTVGEFQTRSSFSLLSLLIDSLENADFIERDDFDEWDEFDPSSSPFPTGFVV